MKAPLLVSLTALLLCPLSAFAAQTAPAYPTLPPAPAVPRAAPAPAMPPALASPAANTAPKNADRVQGRVSAVDTTKRTMTVGPRGAAAPVTVSLAPDANVYVTGIGTLASLKVGDHVTAYGTATPDAPALTSDRIVVLPAASSPPTGRTPKRKAGFHPKRVEGTITTTAPALTLTTLGRIVVTVTPSPTARVETLTAGSLADVRVGQTVEVRLESSGAAPVASEVRVLPARAGGSRGKKNHARAKAALAPIGLTTPAAP